MHLGSLAPSFAGRVTGACAGRRGAEVESRRIDASSGQACLDDRRDHLLQHMKGLLMRALEAPFATVKAAAGLLVPTSSRPA